MLASLAQLTTTCPARGRDGRRLSELGRRERARSAPLPWVGGTFRAEATGLPQQAIVIVVTSVHVLAPGSTPLAGLLPQGVPGCELRVAPEMLQLALAAAGSAQTALVMPATTALAGAVFHHQLIPCELDAAGAIVAVTATNALLLTCGVF